jgi:hypothetical protein
MGARDLARDREPQSRAVGARGCERLKQPVANFRGHPWSRIADAKLKLTVVCGRGDGHYPARRRILHGVENQIVHGAANLIDIEFRRPWSSRNGNDPQVNAFGRRKLAMRLDRLFEKAGEIGFCRLRLTALRHGQQVA